MRSLFAAFSMALGIAPLGIAPACAVSDKTPIAEFKLCSTACINSNAGGGAGAEPGHGDTATRVDSGTGNPLAGGSGPFAVAGSGSQGRGDAGPAIPFDAGALDAGPAADTDACAAVASRDAEVKLDAGKTATDAAVKGELDAFAAVDAASAPPLVTPKCSDFPVPPRDTWVVTASSCQDCEDDAERALDGDEDTRFTTGANQVGDEWLQIDFGTQAAFNQLILHTSADGDHPEHYEVRSTDGADAALGELLVEGDGSSPFTIITLPKAITSRYVRISQTGESEFWWSIHELVVICN